MGELLKDRKKEGSLRFYKPKFKFIFCDMDGESKFMILYMLAVLCSAYHNFIYISFLTYKVRC